MATLDEGAVVANEGSWNLDNAYVQGTSGGGFERFVNHGSLVKSGGNSTIDSTVNVDNTGTIWSPAGSSRWAGRGISGDHVSGVGGGVVVAGCERVE